MRRPRMRVIPRRLMVSAIVIAACAGLALVGLTVYQHRVHLEWYHGVEKRIVRIAAKRPQDVSPNQWAYYVHWTWNLHCNCGTPDQFDWTERAKFLAEFDRRLEGRVDVGLIDWIWDEYAKHSGCGRNYSRNFRPTEPDHIRSGFIGQETEYDLRQWIDKN
jgi:hypothetical protein